MSTTPEDTRPEEGASSTTSRVAGRAHEAVDRAAQSAAPHEARLRESMQRTGEELRSRREKARESSSELVRGLEGYVRENPLASAGIAFAAGMLVSSLLRR